MYQKRGFVRKVPVDIIIVSQPCGSLKSHGIVGGNSQLKVTSQSYHHGGIILRITTRQILLKSRRCFITLREQITTQNRRFQYIQFKDQGTYYMYDIKLERDEACCFNIFFLNQWKKRFSRPFNGCKSRLRIGLMFQFWWRRVTVPP